MDFGYADLSDLVGIPFVDRGRTKEGADCWGIFRLAMERFGVEVPDVSVSAFASEQIREEMARQLPMWRRVEQPQPGDAVTMKHDPRLPETEQHFAVYLGASRIIHTLEKTGSVIVRVDHPIWKNKVAGYYRWNR